MISSAIKYKQWRARVLIIPQVTWNGLSPCIWNVDLSSSMVERRIIERESHGLHR